MKQLRFPLLQEFNQPAEMEMSEGRENEIENAQRRHANSINIKVTA